MPVYCGLDFGTSNTAIALLRTDAAGNTVEHKVIAVEPSVIYFPAEGIFSEAFFVGSEAIDKFLGNNMKGRFIKSIKSLLPYTEYKYTMIGKKPYQPDDILMWMFTYFKQQVDRYLQVQAPGEEIARICIGRPVYFSDNEECDRLAEKRIMNAAHMTGFKERKMAFEPVGALYGFDFPVKEEDVILLGDLGAGTCDFTLIGHYHKQQAALSERANVFTNSGIHIGGDDFDTAVFRHKVTKHFGFGTKYESWGKWLPVPDYIYYQVSNWVHLNRLKTISFIEQLKDIRHGSVHKHKISRLIDLVEKNLVYPLLKEVEAAKIALSGQELSSITFNREGIEINEVLTRAGFGRIIADDVRKIADTVRALADKSEKQAGAITKVVLTGGSSRIEAIRDFFRGTFPGAELFCDEDVFNTVALGLAVLAKEA